MPFEMDWKTGVIVNLRRTSTLEQCVSIMKNPASGTASPLRLAEGSLFGLEFNMKRNSGR